MKRGKKEGVVWVAGLREKERRLLIRLGLAEAEKKGPAASAASECWRREGRGRQRRV